MEYTLRPHPDEMEQLRIIVIKLPSDGSYLEVDLCQLICEPHGLIQTSYNEDRTVVLFGTGTCEGSVEFDSGEVTISTVYHECHTASPSSEVFELIIGPMPTILGEPARSSQPFMRVEEEYTSHGRRNWD
jgi:hypothetical protein